jgi:hypothetical protein
MLLYNVATSRVVEHEEAGKVHGVQHPVYYLSEVLTLAKQRYPHYKKLTYDVRKLRHYFVEHPIIVVTKAPLKNILTNPDATG